MTQNKIIITGPSLDTKKNVSGISSLTNFIINNNDTYHYNHFVLGKSDNEKRGFRWFFRILCAWTNWMFLMSWKKGYLIHFNFALDKRSIIRDLPLILIAQLMNKRMVIHLHGGEYLEKKTAPRWVKFLLGKIFGGRTPKIVLSTYEEKIVKSKFNAKSVNILPNCIDISEAQNFNRSYTNTPLLNLLFIGRIDKNKGLENIFLALSTLKKENIDFNFFMAGSGPGKVEYVKKFSEILDSGFVYNGVVSGNAKTKLFKSSDVFLLPSLYEGLPISLLECMAFGIVPVVTNVGSIGSLVNDGINGIIVEKQSSDSIVRALKKLSNNPDLRERLSQNARSRVFKDFSPSDYIEKLNRIYKRA